MATRYLQGGDKAAAAIRDILRKYGAGTGTGLRVGFLEGATYPEGGLNVPTVAAIQEFGAPAAGIPPRPFFRSMVARHSDEWPEQIADQLRKTEDPVLTLKRMGALISGELRQSIIDTNEPALSPVTVARKGFDKPLVDTGHMLNSIDYEVNGERFEGPRAGNPYAKAPKGK